MNFESLREIVINKRKWSFTHLVWEKNLPVRKIHPNITVTRKTQGTVRVGVIYYI